MVKYCLTDEMWADVLTKPLQGQKLRLMHSKFMNCDVDYNKLHPGEMMNTGVTNLMITGVTKAKYMMNSTHLSIDS